MKKKLQIKLRTKQKTLRSARSFTAALRFGSFIYLIFYFRLVDSVHILSPTSPPPPPYFPLPSLYSHLTKTIIKSIISPISKTKTWKQQRKFRLNASTKRKFSPNFHRVFTRLITRRCFVDLVPGTCDNKGPLSLVDLFLSSFLSIYRFSFLIWLSCGTHTRARVFDLLGWLVIVGARLVPCTYIDTKSL